MALFTDQFTRRDPRSDTPSLPMIYDAAPYHAHRLACSLVEGVPLEKLSEICAALSARFIEQFPGLGLDWQQPWDGRTPALAKHLKFGVDLSVVYGAYALWRLTDLRDIVEPHPPGLGESFDAAYLPPDVVVPASMALIAAMKACLIAQHFQVEEARAKGASTRNRDNVRSRHEKTTNKHRAAAVQLAAKAYQENQRSRSDVADLILDQVFKRVVEKDGKVLKIETYEKKTVLKWLADAGWQTDDLGWPNCSDVGNDAVRP
jgi:hypothetical protein